MRVFEGWSGVRLGVGVLAIAAASCGGKSNPAAPTPAGSLTAPTAKSPVGGIEVQGLRPTLEVNNANVSGSLGPLTYRFEISDGNDFPAGSRTVVIDNVPQGTGSTSANVTSDLQPAQTYFWRARAAAGTITSPYSATETLRTENRGFRSGQTINDPLTNGQTLADERHGGHFVTGPNGGWQADSLSDSLDYTIPTCSSCIVEFDATGFDRSTPPEDVDQKWFSMGDGSTYGGLLDFRDHPWKMHVEKRSGDAGAVKMIWRRGCNDDESCDNTDNLKVPISWDPLKVYHFAIQWGGGVMSVNICEYTGTTCGATVYRATGSGTYAPPNHRIELGTRPRSETLVGARFRNLKVTPR